MSDMKMQAAVEMSVEQPVKALDQIGVAAEKMAGKVGGAADKAGASVDGIGSGASGSADKLTRAEGRMVDSIKRIQTQMDLAGKSASQKFEFNIAAKGLDASKFEPMLAKMRETEKAQAALSAGSVALSSKMGDLAKYALTAGAAFATWSSLKGVTEAMIGAQQSAQKLRNSLEYAAGGAVGAASEISYLREVTNRLGMDFETSSQAYAKFAAATKGSGVSLSQTKVVFEGIASASAKLGLSADETQGALLALSQMASKGTVSAEELRGQLGERLPGAFNIAAKSIGVTTAELGKMLETGQVMASDFLPKFGQALKDNFQAPLSSLTQELNRFSSAWTLWKQEMSDGANGGGFKWLTNGLNESAAAMRALGAEAGVTKRLLAAVGGFEAGAVGANKFDTVAIQTQKFTELKNVRAEIVALQSAEEKGELRLSKTSRNRIDVLRDEEKAIKTALLELAVKRGKETGITVPDLAGDYAASQKKQTDKLAAYLKDVSNAPKAAKIAAEVEKENAAFKSAVSGMSETDTAYLSAVKAHNERVAEIQSKAKESKTSHAKQVEDQYGASFLRQEQMTLNAKALDAELSDAAKSNEEYAKSVAALLDPVEKEASALEAQAANYGLTRAQIEATTIARLEEAKAIATANGASSDSIAFYEREIDARKRIASASASVESQKASEDAAKKSAQDWEKTSDKIGDSITDALMRGFESGKSFAENFGAAVVNMFKSMVLQPTVSAIVTTTLSATGLGGATSAMAGQGSNLLGMASTGNSIYNAATSGASSLYTGFATSGVGSALGLSAEAAGGAAQMAGVMGSGAASGAGMSITTLGAAVPYIGAAIAVAGLVSSLLSSAGGPKNKIMGWGGMDSSGQVTMGGADNVLADGGGPTSRKYDFSPLSAVYTQAVTAAVRQVGSGYASAASLSTTMDPDGTAKNRNVARIARAEGGLVYNNTEKTGKGKDDWAKWAAEESPKMQLAIVADAMRTAGADYKSIAENFVGTSTDMTAAIKDLDSAAVTEMMSTLTSMATAFDSISSHLNKSVTGQAIVNMSAFSGTIDTLTTNINTYYSAFFSSAEQVENTRKSLVSSFAEMGMALPASKAAFRGVVEGIDLTTTSGQSMFATMMSLSSAFSQVADAATAAADTIKAQFLSLYETLTSALDDMTTSGDATKSSRASSQMTLNAAVVASQSGQSILPYASAITSAVSELSKPAEDLYASFSEYARAQGRAIASITSLQSVAHSNSHASGLERVPYDGYQATLHAGEAVVDSASVSAISRYFGGSGSDNKALVAEIKSLRDELVGLRAEARATASNTNKSAKLLERAMPDGDALATRIAA